jgi:imidazolonepropionase-like amidohydrolase
MIKNGVLGIEHGNFLDEDTAKLMVEKNITITPTLATHYGFTVPPYDQFLNETCTEKNKAVMSSGLQALQVASKAGVTICFGSDLVSGMHQFQTKEFTLRSQVQSSLEIMRSMTINNAKLMRLENEVGQVKEGFFADLVVLDKNPLEDVTVLDDRENLLAVVKEGQVAFSSLDNWPVTIKRGPW